tara:strand:+ start:936 stop:1220 length:285 start_codon:yes stop_codon:yes gene_type:complete
MKKLDQDFYNRADEHINLSNDQLSEASMEHVNASMMFSVTRFSSWISAYGHTSKEEFKKSKEETLNHLVKEYKDMLENNLDDYIENFDKYMGKK